MAERPHPHALLPSLWWVGRGGWGLLPPLTPEPDCNVYLLRGDPFDVLIDCGGGPSLAELEANVRLAGGEPERVGELWMTHAHHDHFLRAGHWAAKHPHVRVRISHEAVRSLAAGERRLIGLYEPPADLLLPPELLPLREGDTLRCPPHELRVEELPGHTPDSLGFRGEMDGVSVLFSGDAVLGDQNEVKGQLGWMDGYWRSSVRDYRRTLARLADGPMPDLLLPGHGRVHAGASAARSIRNCRRRLERFAAFPYLDTMLPVAWPPDHGDG